MKLVNDLTEIAVILDRSGSMSSIKDDMEGGLWTLVTEQHGLPGRCRMSLYRFDDLFEIAFAGKPSGEIVREDCELVPRGSTALHDAVVKSLAAIESRIMAEEETERPAIVVIVVITDGHENASRENTAKDSREAIERATKKFGWKFSFLAADPKGFADGRMMAGGIRGASVGQYDAGDAPEAYQRFSNQVGSMRAGKSDEIDVSKPYESDE